MRLEPRRVLGQESFTNRNDQGANEGIFAFHRGRA